ncbi:MAG: YqaE/Pmp3 family membrane protein [Chitinophagaceae bacterium]|nr:YqaE/Pmp3 family membrane protein [Chitinophagaceae bacterium]
MRNKLFTSVSIIAVIIFGLTSCSRNSHVEYTGRYHPNTKINQATAANITKSTDKKQVNELQVAQKELEYVASNDEQLKPLIKSFSQVAPLVPSTLTSQQEKKVNRIFEKIEKQAAKKPVEWKARTGYTQTNQQTSKAIKAHSSGDSKLLYCLLAILLPPLAVALWEDGITINFWIDILLTICFWVPGIIFAWIIIL